MIYLNEGSFMGYKCVHASIQLDLSILRLKTKHFYTLKITNFNSIKVKAFILYTHIYSSSKAISSSPSWPDYNLEYNFFWLVERRLSHLVKTCSKRKKDAKSAIKKILATLALLAALLRYQLCPLYQPPILFTVFHVSKANWLHFNVVC